MFKEFMEEVVAIEKAGVFSEPEIISENEVAKGEEVVGCIADDHYLMALCMAGENRAKAYMDRIPRMSAEEEKRIREEFGPIIRYDMGRDPPPLRCLQWHGRAPKGLDGHKDKRRTASAGSARS